MPDEIKPPKTIPEIGIHLTYLAKAQNKTTEAVERLQATVESMRDGFVTKAEFDDHLLWGQAAVKDTDDRLKVLEKKVNDGDLSLMHRIGVALDNKIVAVIVVLIISSIGWSVYMTFRYQAMLNNLPQITIKD